MATFNCPYCGETTHIRAHVESNVDSYQRSVTMSTPCCKQPVRISPVSVYSVTPTLGIDGKDDWGEPYAKAPRIAQVQSVIAK